MKLKDRENYQESLRVSATVTRLRTACQLGTGMEAQRKPGREMDGPRRLGSGRSDVRKRGMAMGRVDPWTRPSEAPGEGTGAGGARKRKRAAGAVLLSSAPPAASDASLLPASPARPLTERVEKVRDFLDAAGDDFNILSVCPVLVNLPLHRILLSRHGGHLRKSDCAGAATSTGRQSACAASRHPSVRVPRPCLAVRMRTVTRFALL